jgi:ribonuclease HI
VVLQNHHGEFVTGACHFLTSVSGPEGAELMACKRALELAKEAGLSKVCLETDCLSAVAKIRSSDIDRSSHGPLVEEIKKLLRDFSHHSIKHARRCCNGVAHTPAKEGCMNKNCNIWLGVPPGIIVNLIASDAAVD